MIIIIATIIWCFWLVANQQYQTIIMVLAIITKDLLLNMKWTWTLIGWFTWQFLSFGQSCKVGQILCRLSEICLCGITVVSVQQLWGHTVQWGLGDNLLKVHDKLLWLSATLQRFNDRAVFLFSLHTMLCCPSVICSLSCSSTRSCL